ncbi:MAG: PaaI family thioesterase [Sphaerochaetaceae bacterium]|nr:PaaI family thioesterase [Sphaerochaetaceae bacterium]
MRRDLEATRKFFADDLFAVHSGIEIDQVGEGYARCSMEIRDFHKNARGVVMGGAIFTLADLCYGAACDGQACSMTSEINYLHAAKGKKLFAEAKMIKDGRTTVFYEIRVTDDEGRLVAFATMTGFRIQRPGS